MDSLTEQALASQRLRMNLDLRDSEDDTSQRMLNAIEPGSLLHIYRQQNTSEVMVCLRGKLRLEFYDDWSVRIRSLLNRMVLIGGKYSDGCVAYGACTGERHMHFGDEEWCV